MRISTVAILITLIASLPTLAQDDTQAQIDELRVRVEALESIVYVCGDGTVTPNEGCDDGNNVNGDGCDANCKIEICGNGILQAEEQCDDGNTVAGDGCSPACTIEVCGNDLLDPGEECDDGNVVNGDGCSSTCTIEPRCGDDNVDPGEECDDGNNVNGDGCSATCTIEAPPAVCGDGNLDPGEECDDGNNTNDDGCDSNCDIEQVTPPSNLVFHMTGADNPGDGSIQDVAKNNTGSCSNCPSWIADKNGNLNEAYDFSSDRVTFPHTADLDLIGGNFTVSFWVKMNALGGGTWKRLIYKNTGSNSFQVDQGSHSGRNSFWFNVKSNGRDHRTQSNTSVQTGQWYHVVATWKNGNKSTDLYVNGVLDERSPTNNAGSAGSSQNLFIGVRADGNSNTLLNGKMDDVKIYNVALSASKIATLFSTGPSEAPDGVCGNNVVDPGEACDTGGQSLTCDADCTLVACGDGLVNSAAGEQCDDGNASNGDGCSSSCQIEDDPPPPPPGDITMVVSTSGTNSGNCNPSSPCRTIAYAAARTNPGDTVFIRPGTYNERVKITRSGTSNAPITYKGDPNGGTIVHGSGGHVFEFYAGSGVQLRYINFEDMTVQNGTHGFNLINTSFLNFDNMVIRRCGMYGMFFGGYSAEGTHHVNVRNSIIYRNGRFGNGAGMRIGERANHWAHDILIVDCVTHSNAAYAGASAETGTGININSPQDVLNNTGQTKTHHITLRRVASYNNGSSGLSTQLPHDVTMEDCIVFDNNVINSPNGEGSGIRIGFFNTKRTKIIRCITFNNRWTGIKFETVNGGNIYNSIAYRNSFGTNAGRDYRRNISTGTAVTSKNNIAFACQGLDDTHYTAGTVADFNLVGDGVFSHEGPNTISGDPRFVNPPMSGADLGLRTWVNGSEINANDAADLTTYAEIRAMIVARFALQNNSPCKGSGTTIPGVSSSTDMGPFVNP